MSLDLGTADPTGRPPGKGRGPARPSGPARPPARGWFDTPALRRDLRAASLDAGLALVVALGVFVVLYSRVETRTSAMLLIMPEMADAGQYWMYLMCQAFGWAGLLWAWLTVMLGLLRSTRSPFGLPVARVESLHRTTSLTTVGLMLVHATWFFAELVRENEDGAGAAGRVWDAFVRTFVPGGYDSGTGVLAVLLGLLALYLAVPLGLAYYARRAMGARVWRTLHASILVVYVLSVWHTLLYGSDSWYDGWFRTTVWLLQLPVATLLAVRLVRPAYRRRTGALDRAGGLVARAAAVGTIAALLLVVASGRDGGRTYGVDGAGLSVHPPLVWTGLAVFAGCVAVACYRAVVEDRRVKDSRRRALRA